MKTTPTETNTISNPTRSQVRRRWNPTKLLLLLIIILVGTTFYFYKRSVTVDAQKDSQAEIDRIVAKVAKLMVLPEGEEPTIATVSDIEKLKGQPFFANAKNGDKVLIYTTAKTAILYDPVANKIVQVAPINIGDPKTTTIKKAPEPVTPAPTTTTPAASGSTN